MADRIDFTLFEFSDTDFTVTAPKDITGYTATLTFRDMRGSANILLALTSPSNGLTVLNNTVSVKIAAAVVSSLTWLNAQWDLVVENGSETLVLAFGNASVRVGITQ